MKSNLRGLAHYGSREMEVPAEHFNQVRLALCRLGDTIRLSIPGLQNIDLVIDHESWIAVDQFRKDTPVLALTDFARRNDLHRPARCRVYFYYASSELILNRILQAMHRLLAVRLRQQRRYEEAQVIPLCRPSQAEPERPA